MFKSEYDEVKANLIKKSLEKDKTDVIVPIERRKGKDFRLKFINIMCFIIWTILFIIIAIIEKAGVSFAYIAENDLLWVNIAFWKANLLNAAFICTIICIIICSLCIILNFTRLKRRSDRIKKSLIVGELFCFIIGIFLIFKLY